MFHFQTLSWPTTCCHKLEAVSSHPVGISTYIWGSFCHAVAHNFSGSAARSVWRSGGGVKKKRKNRASPKRRRRTMNSDSLALPSLVDKKRHKRTSPSGALLGGREGGSRAKRRSYCGTYALQCLTHHLHFIYGASSLDSFINEAN